VMAIVVAMETRSVKRFALVIVAALALPLVGQSVSAHHECAQNAQEGRCVFYLPHTDPEIPPPTAIPAGSMTEIWGDPNGIAVLSVGVTNNTSRGYIQVLDCSDTAGAYSNLNADHPGQTIAGLVITKLDAEGKACIYNHMTTDVFVDLQGYLDAAAFTPDARRLKDTRTTPTTAPIAAGGRTKFVGKPNGIAVVSIVGTQSVQRGYLQVLACSAPNGGWSNLNLERSGQTIANMAIIELDAKGEACVYTHGGAHIVVDLQGYLDPATFTPHVMRVMETRGIAACDLYNPDGTCAGTLSDYLPDTQKPAVLAGDRRAIKVPLPPNGLAVLSLVATQTARRGYVQALPCDEANGAWSNLNTDHANQTIANLAIVPLDSNGRTCLYTHGGTHLVADVQGYLDPTVFTPFNGRILDTRVVDDGSGGGDY
jgi:hypothetical protein